jgi:benzoylformate decarboxylase
MHTTIDTARFVGMDFSDPNINLQAIAEGFGARVETIAKSGDVPGVLSRALAHAGPSFLLIEREP